MWRQSGRPGLACHAARCPPVGRRPALGGQRASWVLERDKLREGRGGADRMSSALSSRSSSFACWLIMSCSQPQHSVPAQRPCPKPRRGQRTAGGHDGGHTGDQGPTGAHQRMCVERRWAVGQGAP
jgi:hypothetical protein